MRKFALIILVVIIFSCEKDDVLILPEKHCWTCERYHPAFSRNNYKPYAVRFVVCDKTEAEIRSYEKDHSYNGIQANKHTVTCWRKY